jgi:hypothetical protein
VVPKAVRERLEEELFTSTGDRTHLVQSVVRHCIN